MPLLSRDRIVAQAQETIERRGYEALSLRGLASSLDVTAPALYDHVQSKDDVLRAVAARGYEALAAASAVAGGRAIERVRERSLAYVRFARDRSELFRLMFRYRPAAVLIEADNELAAATNLFDTNSADLVRAISDGDLARARHVLHVVIVRACPPERKGGSVGPERARRIDGRGPADGHIRRGERGHEDQSDRGCETARIPRGHSEEQRIEQA
jgi:AcrR family transcriptional regulator